MKNLIVIFLFVFTAMQLFAQKSERITGIWWNDEKTSKLEVKKEANGSYSATIVYIIPEKYENGMPQKDTENPDPKLRDRSRLGLTIMTGLRYDTSANEWNGGRIYDPQSGKTYDCYVWMEDRNDMLFMKGYVVGIRWLGKSTEWTRTTL
ncbi:MAG: hypothetical protein A2W90_20090 [Bacteroidetes bacterium GWF2_42_66]|nr:MAG: hypothetical protein A2W92_12940 [Bacteroidetes bacterium GWA2_42_15]OFX98418.1 MAG: hypothetical protein A2W89_08455 [Bacteroidetes bacterium GWE2_42_39]OFY42803.1 MAG: hypothetical protein A2W90_20090 [Bacteroidetes bacterium GWF2_42_66]HBL74425.1 DUF2147 domain-containing protein [Prolixibacteraceae bacterium]HCR90952.1 DUF2147 domain-containing protein [Prolixibacteraceae bacterium]